MKIIEILVGDQENPIGDTFVPADRIPDQDLMAHIANAFSQNRVVKLLWDLDLVGEPAAPGVPNISQEQIEPLTDRRNDPVR